MKLTSEDRGGGVVVLQPTGRLDLLSGDDFRTAVSAAVDGGGRVVVVDLGGIDFVDSSGLGALIAGLKTTRTAGGDLRIANPGEQARMVLELTRLDKVLRIHPNVDAAVAHRA